MNTQRQRTMTPQQLRAIWTVARGQGLDEDALRDLVEAVSGQRSTRGLTRDQASDVLGHLTGPMPQSGRGKSRHREMDGRLNMATSKQLRKIEAMWGDRSHADDKPAAMRRFLQHKFSVSDLRFLSRTRASDVIVALSKMEVI